MVACGDQSICSDCLEGFAVQIRSVLSRRDAIRHAHLKRRALRANLTPEEMQVLEFRFLGFSKTEIAAKLGLSPRSVDKLMRRATRLRRGPFRPDDNEPPPAAAMAARPFHYTRTDAVARHPQVPSRRPRGGRVVPLWPDQGQTRPDK